VQVVTTEVQEDKAANKPNQNENMRPFFCVDHNINETKILE